MTPVRRAGRKRILVLSASFGGPQATVADSVVDCFRLHHAAAVDVRQVDFLGQFMPGINTLAKFGYQQSVRFFPELNGDLSHAIEQQPENPVIHELAAGAFERVVSFLTEYRPDAVLSVLPAAAAVASEAGIALGFRSVAVLTDFTARGAWLHPATEGYFVASREVRDELVVRSVEWGRVSVSGLPGPEVRSADRPRALRRKDLGLADRFTCVLLAQPGSSGELVDIASRVASRGIQVAVQLAEAPRLSRPIAALAERTDLVRFSRDGAGARELMGVADIIASRAGGTTSVSGLSLGCPLILYNPVPGQECYNVDFLVNAGAAMLARDEEDVAEKLAFLSTHPSRLRQMAVESAGIGRADAAQTVCGRVVSLVSQGGSEFDGLL